MIEELLDADDAVELKLRVVTSNDPATRAAGRLAMTDLLQIFWGWVQAEQARGTNLNDLMNGFNGFIGAMYSATFKMLGIDNDDGKAAKSVARSIVHILNRDSADEDDD